MIIASQVQIYKKNDCYMEKLLMADFAIFSPTFFRGHKKLTLWWCASPSAFPPLSFLQQYCLFTTMHAIYTE